MDLLLVMKRDDAPELYDKTLEKFKVMSTTEAI